MSNFLGNFAIVWTFEMFLTLGLAFAVPISGSNYTCTLLRLRHHAIKKTARVKLPVPRSEQLGLDIITESFHSEL